MASTTTPLPEWLVIVPDHADALEKRMKSRPQHIEDLKADREDMLLWGGAMLHTPLVEGEPPQARGSAMLIGASTREEVVERLKKDVYVKDGVWDFEKVQIIPFRSAIRKPL